MRNNYITSLDDVIEYARNQKPLYQFYIINYWWNAYIPYVTDEVVHGKKNYIATLRETLTMDTPRGDCDSKARGIYESLKRLGYSPWFVVGTKLINKKWVSHAWVECRGYVLDTGVIDSVIIESSTDRFDLSVITRMNDSMVITAGRIDSISKYSDWADCVARSQEEAQS